LRNSKTGGFDYMMVSDFLSVAFSSCPNDTFIFCHLSQEPDVRAHLADVETLNRRAFGQAYDVTKLSFHAWLHLQDHYEVLNVGAALGRGCGPLLVCREPFSGPLPEEAVVAVPGEHTTAHLLLRLYNPGIKNCRFMPFNRIMPAVAGGEVDAGVVIHEGRFVYRNRGLHCLRDLGEWWEGETGLPLPLGCIAALKALGAGRIRTIEQRIRASVEAALRDPNTVRDYVKTHAQELDDEVIERHIQTYVNGFTLDLGKEGRAAVARLRKMAKAAGVV
jgi:1,4-dihydroxy-6-naphthoate synthase